MCLGSRPCSSLFFSLRRTRRPRLVAHPSFRPCTIFTVSGSNLTIRPEASQPSRCCRTCRCGGVCKGRGVVIRTPRLYVFQVIVELEQLRGCPPVRPADPTAPPAQPQGCGRGTDAGPLETSQRARAPQWRRQARNMIGRCSASCNQRNQRQAGPARTVSSGIVTLSHR